MLIKTINGVEYLLIPLDDIRNLKTKPEVLDVPRWEDFKAYALENKPSVDIGDLWIKYKAWREARWTDGNGKKIKNWKSKLLHNLKYLKETPKGTNMAPKWEPEPLPEIWDDMPESLKKHIDKIGKE